jgi:hypothetical protein
MHMLVVGPCYLFTGLSSCKLQVTYAQYGQRLVHSFDDLSISLQYLGHHQYGHGKIVELLAMRLDCRGLQHHIVCVFHGFKECGMTSLGMIVLMFKVRPSMATICQGNSKVHPLGL